MNPGLPFTRSIGERLKRARWARLPARRPFFPAGRPSHTTPAVSRAAFRLPEQWLLTQRPKTGQILKFPPVSRRLANPARSARKAAASSGVAGRAGIPRASAQATKRRQAWL